MVDSWKVLESIPGTWRAEAGPRSASFSGPDAERSAEEYARWKRNGLLEGGEVLLTRKIERQQASDQMMEKIILSFTVMGKPVKIHIEFKNPIRLETVPSTVLEADLGLLEEIEAQVWTQKSSIDKIDEVASINEEDDEDGEDGEEDDQD